MHSWVFRNRRRLERLYGIAPARSEPKAHVRHISVPEARQPQTPRGVIIPAPRRVA